MEDKDRHISIFNTTVADGLAMQGVRASAAMVLNTFSRSIPFQYHNFNLGHDDPDHCKLKHKGALNKEPKTSWKCIVYFDWMIYKTGLIKSLTDTVLIITIQYCSWLYLNSLTPGKCKWNFRYVIFKQILVIGCWGISCEIALIWMSQDFTNDQSILVQVMAWCHQAPSHYLSQCWPRSLSPYGVTMPQWVNSFWPRDAIWHQWCHMASQNMVNIGWGIGLLTDSNKPIHQPMLTNNHWCLVAFTSGQFHRKCSRQIFFDKSLKIINENYSHISQGPMS